MPSSYTANLGLELQSDGENSSTWGQKVNTAIELIEDAISTIGSISMTTDASKTLTSVDGGADEARSAVLVVTSTVTLTATRSIIIPGNAKLYLVHNNTSGAQSITVKTAAGSGITIGSGKKVIVYCDGTDVHYGVSELPATKIDSLSLGTDLAIVDGGTGAGTATDARSNLGVIIGSHVQAWDAALDDLAGLTQAADTLPYFNSTSSMATTPLTAYGRSLIDDTDASGARTTLGLGAMATKASVAAGDIDTDAITNAKIANDAVTGAEIADNAIDSEHYTDNSIDAAHLAHDLALPGNPTSPTQTTGNNTTRIATTAFVQTATPFATQTTKGMAKIWVSGGDLYIQTS